MIVTYQTRDKRHYDESNTKVFCLQTKKQKNLHGCTAYTQIIEISPIHHTVHRTEHSARIRKTRDRQKERLLRIKFVIYGTTFYHIWVSFFCVHGKWTWVRHVTNPVNREAVLGRFARHCLTQVYFSWTQKNKTLIPYIYNIFQQKKNFILKAPDKKKTFEIVS